METITFDEFCNKINKSFESILFLTELQKTSNEDLINIIKEQSNGR